MTRPLDRGALGRRYLTDNILDRLESLERQSRQNDSRTLGLGAAATSYTRRYLLEGWFQENISGTQSAVQLYRWGNAITFQRQVAFPVSGRVTRLMIYSTGARTAGTLDVELYVAGTASGMIATLNDTDTQWVEEGGEGVSFEAGEELTLRVTTAGWTPTTGDLQASIEVELG